MKMNRWLVQACLLIMLCTPAIANAETAADKLAELMSGYESFSSAFEQYSVNNDGRRAQQASGEMQLAKPDRFVWKTNEPFPQTIVGDGQYVWVYDPDLEQATRRSASAQLSNAPALLLNGQVDKLKDDFTIRALKTATADQLFELVPLNTDASFQRIRLFFTNKLLTELMLEDHLGQRTTIILAQQKKNPVLGRNHFSFEAPEGTDIILNEAE